MKNAKTRETVAPKTPAAIIMARLFRDRAPHEERGLPHREGLFLKYSASNELSCAGIEPVSWLFEKSRYLRRSSREREAGI
jgi:hypothetical protein